jgi:anti-sigma regulatory factor (Ser/Thr protein kinase)
MEYSHRCGALEISVPAQTTALAHVRRQLRAFLAEHDVREDQRHPVVLVTHELAANAIVHGSADESELVSITVELEPQSLVIRVLDPARTENGPAVLEPTDWRESGRGMLMVGELATWSDRLIDGRREVRAELPLLP